MKEVKYNYNFCVKTILALLLSFNIFNAQTLEQGIKLMEVEKYKEAKTVFENIANTKPKEASSAYFNLGKLSLIDAKVDEAKEYFQKGLNVDKENAYNFVGMGNIALLKKDSVEAYKQFEEALDMTDFKDVYVFIAVADAFINSDVKNLSKAFEWMNKAKTIKDQKKNPMLYFKLAELYVKANNGSLASENYRITINYDDKFIPAYLGLAQVYLKIKIYNDAEANLNSALAIDSTYSLIHKEFAEFYNTVRNFGKAAASYKTYIDLSERTIPKLERYATLLYLAKGYKEAIDVIKEVQTQKEADAQLTHILAFSYYALEDFENGIPAFNNYFKITPQNELISTDFQYYGRLQSLASNDSLAAENYLKAMSMDTSLVDLHGDVASIYFKAKKYQEAANEFALKEKLTGKLSIREHFDYGRAYMILKQYANADSVFKRFSEVKPDLPIGYLWRARANSNIDTTNELGYAKPYYEKFIELVTATPETEQAKYKNDLMEAYRYLGYFYYLKREDPNYKDTWRSNYQNYWEKVLTLDPENKAAKDALDNLKILK
jgi:tetratricopeptide (TPR) repeat protein